MEQGLLQEDIAKLIGVSPDCIANWEKHRAFPQIQFMPAITAFLGFLPLAIDISNLGGQIFLYRNTHGLSSKKFGELLGVDASTIRDWEKRKRYPTKYHFKQINLLIGIM